MKVYKNGTRFGPFKVTSQIQSQGAMSTIYKAVIDGKRHPAVKGKEVALKVVPGDRHSQIFKQLLTEETELLRHLRHPNIVKIYPPSVDGRVYGTHLFARADPGDGSKPWYFAMELLGDETIADILESNQSHGWRLELVYRIAQAVDYLHIRDVAHRDLKPSNIVFRTSPKNSDIHPDPVLIDFGLAEKRLLRRMHGDDSMGATIQYAPPEWIDVFEQGRRDPGSLAGTVMLSSKYDIWSLGVIAYEILTRGQYPFGDSVSDNVDKIMFNIRHNKPDMSPIRSGQLRQLLRGMLHKDPRQRWPIEEVLYFMDIRLDLIAPRI
jgi:serine/threonine protein kinase